MSDVYSNITEAFELMGLAAHNSMELELPSYSEDLYSLGS